MRKTVLRIAATFVVAACGGDSTGDGSGDASSESTGGGATTVTTTNGSMSADDSSTGTASATATETSAGETTTTGSDGTTTTSTADGTGTTTTGGSDSSTTGALTAEGSSTDPTDTDTGDDCFGGGGGGMIEFSYIWIANSGEGTVSKINTFDGIEEGRYYTSPDESNIPNAPNDGPSRTSVNLYGDVAVANRNGGITKFAARIDDCLDVNANGMIDTSTGPLDVLPWGEDECMLWHHPTPNGLLYNEGPRPIAWEAVYDPVTCEVDQSPRLWFGYYELSTNTGFFERLDGATGITLDGVDVAWSGQNWGPYGGAVNADGDFWVIGYNTGPGIRIDADTLTVDVAQPQMATFFYGMALDADGEPWVGGCDSTVYHYDTVAGEWESVANGPGCLRGLQVDTEGRAFIAHNGFPCGMMVVDTIAEQVIDQNVNIPGCSTPVGVSIDIEGYVWVVDQGGFAFKIDPDTYQVVLTVEGLNQPYTYSDMTGAGLALQIMPM